jgi:hypothetical protein
MLRRLRKRDPYCLHCGDTETLVPHHRRNRQMGGSKLLDRLDNLMMICSYYNGAMESNGVVAENARRYGHKLTSWQDFDAPVFDECTGEWYRLDIQGGKSLADSPDEPLF